MPAPPLQRLRKICLALPEAVERPFGKHVTFQIRGKNFVMHLDNHHGDGRLAVWCKAAPGEQQLLVDLDPERFFVPPYVGPSGWIGVRLDRRIDWPVLTRLVTDSYRLIAPKRVAAKLAGGRPRK